jgi:hypothetical protein
MEGKKYLSFPQICGMLVQKERKEHGMARIMIKEEAKSLIDKMPDNTTWEDLMHEIYVRQAIEAGLEDRAAGRTRDVQDVRKKYGLSS